MRFRKKHRRRHHHHKGSSKLRRALWPRGLWMVAAVLLAICVWAVERACK